MHIKSSLFIIVSLFILASCDQSESSAQSETDKLQSFLLDRGLSDSEFLDCISRSYPDLTVNTISSVTKLNCHSNVYSVEGIDVFSNLYILELKGTHISKIDISGLDNIRRLRVIDDDATTQIETANDNVISSVFLENIPISNLSLDLFPKLETLYLISLNLDSLNTYSQATIDKISMSRVVVPDLRFTNMKIRELNITESNFTSVTMTALTGIDLIGIVNSNIDTVEIGSVNFVGTIIVVNSGVNEIQLGINKFIGNLSLTDNNIQSINLDNLGSVGPIDLTGNPLTADAISYLETKTGLDIKF